MNSETKQEQPAKGTEQLRLAKIAALLKWMDETFGPNWCTVVFTDLFAVVFIYWLIQVAQGIAPNDHARTVNYLLMLIGALVGWAVAMLSAPYGKTDRDVLAQVAKIASVFITGYAISKLDRFIEATSFADKTPVMNTWLRAGLFGATALLAMIFVVTNRMYFRPAPPDPRGQNEAEQAASPGRAETQNDSASAPSRP